jgi:ParB family chromosome partitioning protein
MKVRDISLEEICASPYQTRIDYRDIESLANNIKEVGLQQPVTVRKLATHKYELISGSRRLEAARLLGWDKISAIVKDASDVETAIMCLSENLQRENLNPVEEAKGYQMLIDNFKMTHNEIAGKVGKSRPYITNSLSLLQIDEFLQACLICGELTISHTRIINTAPDKIEKYRLADIVMDWGLSVQELKDMVTRLQEKQKHLLWTRNIPIEHIKIPSIAFSPENGYYEGGAVIADTGMVLLGGLGRLMNARKRGEETVETIVVYFTDWLKPSENWISEEPRATIDPTDTSSSKFSKILAELMGDTEEMYQKYPLHLIKDENDYLAFLPRD